MVIGTPSRLTTSNTFRSKLARWVRVAHASKVIATAGSLVSTKRMGKKPRTDDSDGAGLAGASPAGGGGGGPPAGRGPPPPRPPGARPPPPGRARGAGPGGGAAAPPPPPNQTQHQHHPLRFR